MDALPLPNKFRYIGVQVLARFCVYCGSNDTPENPVIDSVCLRCRIKRGELVRLEQNTYYFDLCKVCGSLKVGYRWIDTNDFESAIDYIINNFIPDKIKPAKGIRELRIDGYDYVTTPSWHTDIDIIVSGKYGIADFRVPLRITIYFRPTKCPRCIMYDSREYEALVQIRGIHVKELKKILEEEFVKEPRLGRDYIEAIETKNGVDIYFYSHGAARKLARRLSHRLGMNIKENYEITGTRSGKQRTRLHISLRKRTA